MVWESALSDNRPQDRSGLAGQVLEHFASLGDACLSPHLNLLAFDTTAETYEMLATRILTATIVTGLCLQSASAQILPRQQATAPAVSAATAPPITPTEEPSFWSGIPLPKITMPKITMPKMPADAFAPVKASARKVSAGAKKAWEGTRELLSFGSGSGDNAAQTRVASRQQPSIWSRMFSSQPPEDTGPGTIGEFMNGERLK